MLALLRQLAARTLSSISLTLMLRSFFSFMFSSLTSAGVSSNSITFFVVVDEDIEVMAQDGGSLHQRIIRA